MLVKGPPPESYTAGAFSAIPNQGLYCPKWLIR